MQARARGAVNPDGGVKPKTTICLLQLGRGFDMNRYVLRTFQTADAAHKWMNAQSRNCEVRRVSGARKVGDRIGPMTRTLPLDLEVDYEPQ